MEGEVRIPKAEREKQTNRVCDERQQQLGHSSGTFYTLTTGQSAISISQWLKWRYYRELVLLIEQGSPQTLIKALALLGPHYGVN